MSRDSSTPCRYGRLLKGEAAISAEANKELVTQTWKSFVKGDLKVAFANM